MGGHLTITGPGVSVRLSGDAGGPATLVVEGGPVTDAPDDSTRAGPGDADEVDGPAVP